MEEFFQQVRAAAHACARLQRCMRVCMSASVRVLCVVARVHMCMHPTEWPAMRLCMCVYAVINSSHSDSKQMGHSLHAVRETTFLSLLQHPVTSCACLCHAGRERSSVRSRGM